MFSKKEKKESKELLSQKKPKEQKPKETVQTLIETAKSLGLTGLSKLKKAELFEKIKHHFMRQSSAIIIQKYVRRQFILNYHRIRRQNRNEPVNTTDFYTLELLSEIPKNQLFICTDAGFTYGFDILSLEILIRQGYGQGQGHGHGQQQQQLQNPYTRTPLSESVKKDILSFLFYFQITNIQIMPEYTKLSFKGKSLYPSSIHPETNKHMSATLLTILAIREKPLYQRIDDIFGDICSLGYFVYSEWLINLSRRNIIYFYYGLVTFWTTRGNVLNETKRAICTITQGNALYQVEYPSQILYSFSTNDIMELCVIIMENLMYGSGDIEMRRMGAMYILIQLTHVSEMASTGLPWLVY